MEVAPQNNSNGEVGWQVSTTTAASNPASNNNHSMEGALEGVDDAVVVNVSGVDNTGSMGHKRVLEDSGNDDNIADGADGDTAARATKRRRVEDDDEDDNEANANTNANAFGLRRPNKGKSFVLDESDDESDNEDDSGEDDEDDDDVAPSVQRKKKTGGGGGGKGRQHPDLETFHSNVICAPSGTAVPSRKHENLRMRVRFSPSTALKTLLSAVRALKIKEVPMTVVRSPSFTGVIIYVMESSTTCLVYGTIDSCTVTFYDKDGNEETGDVNITRQIGIDVLFCHLKTLNTNIVLDILYYHDHSGQGRSAAAPPRSSDGFYLDWYMNEAQLDESTIFVPFLVDVNPPRPFDFRCKYRVETDVSEFVQILKMAVDQHCYNTSEITLESLTPIRGLKEGVSVNVMRCTIQSEVNGSYVKKNISAYEERGGSVGLVPIRVCDPALVCDSNLKSCMKGIFQAHYLLKFLETVKTQTVELQLEDGLPMIATHYLDGADTNSVVHFVLAPRLDEKNAQ